MLVALSLAGSGRAEVFFEADFDGGPDGFAFVDDAFRGTSQPAYAQGAHLTAGGATGGGLEVVLGNVDGTTILGMSGGFARTITLPAAADEVSLTFRYHLEQSSEYESDELSQVMVTFDGVPLAGAGVDFVAQIAGDGNGGPPRSTGWTQFSIGLGSLTAGSHALVLGGYNNKKTLGDESSRIRFDDVLLAGEPVAPCVVDADCADADVCTDDVCDAGVCAHPPNVASCDDGLGCTSGDVCSAGVCAGQDDCPGDASCGASSGVCEMPAADLLVGGLDLQRFKARIAALASSDPPIGGSRHWSRPGNAAALDQLEGVLASYGYAVSRHAYSYSGQTRANVYATKIGSLRPDEMVIVSAHMDSVNQESAGSVFAPGANDDASGCALVLELARVLAEPAIVTDRSVRFIFWNNEETGLNGSNAYVADRRPLQGVESPPGSGLYPEPRWIAVITHDQLLWDHGLPSGPTQISGADIDIEFQASSTFAADSLALANLVDEANRDFAPAYPSEVTDDMCCTDSVPFQNHVASVSVRDNRRRAEIGNGSNPTWHRNSDVYATYSEADFALGFSAVQATTGAVARIANARLASSCGNATLDAGEGCDDGNVRPGDCCSPECAVELAGSPCREAAGACDLAETCDGVLGTCPPDLLGMGECRAAVDACDVAEACDGVSSDCPADALAPAGALCRAASGACDRAERCSGDAPTCPEDLLATPADICRAAAGPCDQAESCSGASPDCPVDAFVEDVACDDGDACTTSEFCSAGQCGGATTLDCDDLDPCTADSCDGSTGCAHAAIPDCVSPAGVDAGTLAGRVLLVALLLAVAGVALSRSRVGSTRA